MKSAEATPELVLVIDSDAATRAATVAVVVSLGWSAVELDSAGGIATLASTQPTVVIFDPSLSGGVEAELGRALDRFHPAPAYIAAGRGLDARVAGPLGH